MSWQFDSLRLENDWLSQVVCSSKKKRSETKIRPGPFFYSVSRAVAFIRSCRCCSYQAVLWKEKKRSDNQTMAAMQTGTDPIQANRKCIKSMISYFRLCSKNGSGRGKDWCITIMMSSQYTCMHEVILLLMCNCWLTNNRMRSLGIL